MLCVSDKRQVWQSAAVRAQLRRERTKGERREALAAVIQQREEEGKRQQGENECKLKRKNRMRPMAVKKKPYEGGGVDGTEGKEE